MNDPYHLTQMIKLYKAFLIQKKECIEQHNFHNGLIMISFNGGDVVLFPNEYLK